MFRSIVVGTGLLGIMLIGTAAGVRAIHVSPIAASEEEALECEDETVYGTVVVIDETRGMLGLLGTRYQFFALPEVNLGELEGREVKIDIGRDCVIRAIRILDSESETVT